jgi:hypothetical protein
MEFDKTDVELYYEVEEEMISIKDKMCGLDSIKSTDGHTFRVERDVSKNRVNILPQSTTRQTGLCRRL